MSKQKLFIISELFYPEESTTATIMTEIAKVLSKNYDITVLAGKPAYKIDKEATYNLPQNINIIRFEQKETNKNNLLKRFDRAFNFVKQTKKYIKKNMTSSDKIFMVTNPVFNTLLIPRLTKKMKIELNLLVHDVFPENAIQAGIIKNNSFIYKIIKKMFDKSYSYVDKCIVLGRDMEELVKSKTKGRVSVHCIENWANLDNIYPQNKEHRKDKIVIKFSGNLGRVQGLEDFLKIIKKTDNKYITYVFAGDGAISDKLKEYVRLNSLDNVQFEPSYYRKDENKVLNDCDISLICLGESMYGLGVPSKTYNCMAVGKPIIFIGPRNSEIYKEVEENKLGFSFSFNDEEEIVDFFNKIDFDYMKKLLYCGENARKCAELKYSKECILNKYLEII